MNFKNLCVYPDNNSISVLQRYMKYVKMYMWEISYRKSDNMSVKIERINNMLVEEISYILATEIKDEDIKFVTITGANTTNDLSFAKIYFTTLKEKEKTLEALNNASGFIRKMLADRIEIRHIPELTFIYDESIEYGKRIEQIIENINENKEQFK